MQEIRCTKCNKLLCKVSFPIKPGGIMEVSEEVGINGVKKNGETLEIKCPHNYRNAEGKSVQCKMLNIIMIK
jgi:hypothetical protein